MDNDRESDSEGKHEHQSDADIPGMHRTEDVTTDTGSNDSDEGDKEISQMSKEFDEIVASTSDTDAHTPKPLERAQKPPETAPHKSLLGGNLNKYFLYTLVGGLIISALISVFAVLAGEFNSTLARALGTTVSMVVHTLILLFLVAHNRKRENKAGEILLNTLLVIATASFVTSILAIWGVIGGRTVANLYQVYLYSFGAVLWSQLMLNIGSNLLDKPTRVTSLTSIGFTVILYLQLLPTIFTDYPNMLSEFYYRGMAAVAILLATSSVLTIVFHRIYRSKHPEIKSTESRGPVWNLIVVCIFLFFGAPLLFALVAMLSSLGSSMHTDYKSTPSPSSYVISEPSTQPKPTPDTKTYGYDSEALSEAPSKQYNTQKTCINASQHKPDSKIEIFERLEPGTNPRIVTKSPQSQRVTRSTPLYPETVFKDKNCYAIPSTSLRQGDKLYLYYTHETDTMPPYQLSIVQKLD